MKDENFPELDAVFISKYLWTFQYSLLPTALL